MKNIVLSLLMVVCCMTAFGKNPTNGIRKIVRGMDAEVGVAVLHKGRTYTVSNDAQYPLMSVFKFHVAVTALKKMEKEGIPLDRMVCIGPEQMETNTYSPLRDRYPCQEIQVTYREVIEYTIILSDNNTCDWLINFVGGIREVDSYIKSLGIDKLNLTETERTMHEDIMRCYNNWSTPLAVAELLKKIYTEGVLSDEHFGFLEKTMLACASGTDKLKAGLPADCLLGHKTGHSDRTAEGIKISDADAGVVYMPDGDKCYIAVIVKDSKESDKANAKIMSDIMHVVYEALLD